MKKYKVSICLILLTLTLWSQNNTYNITGTWYQNGDPKYKCQILQNQNGLVFSVAGYTTSGFFTATNKVYASDWESEGIIAQDGQTIYWNGQNWTRNPIKYDYPDIGGIWYSDGFSESVLIDQSSGQVNIHLRKEVHIGYFQSSNQLYVGDWNALATVSNDRIAWNNQTWTRNQVSNNQLVNVHGTYYINGHEFQKATIIQNGNAVNISTLNGNSIGEIVNDYQIYAKEWNAYGNITPNGITWSNQTWYNSPQNITYPNIQGIYKGTQNEEIKITQNGNKVNIQTPNSSTSGYFFDKNYIYAEAWDAYGQIVNNSLKWNNQSWIFMDALGGVEAKPTRDDPESDPDKPCNECCEKCRKLCNNENATYNGICIAGQIYGDHCDCGN